MKKLREKDLQAVADLTTEVLGGHPVKVELKDIKAGYFIHKKNLAVVPEWIFEDGDVWVIYYIVHEVCHQWSNPKEKGMHSQLFKKKEEEGLKAWNIEMERMRVYPKKLYMNGFAIWP